MAGERSVGAWLAISLMAPMLLSGLLFKTYDIAMGSLPMEILRQLNAPFVLAELVVIVCAMHRGFRLRTSLMKMDRFAQGALMIFGITFWVGGVFVSKSSPFATLFNLSYVVHFTFLAAVAYIAIAWRASDTQLFTRIVCIALMGFAAIIAICFFLPPAGVAVETIRWQFAIPGFISLRLFGAMAAPWATFVLYLALARGHEKDYQGWIFAACSLTCAMVVWSGTRAAVLGIGVAGMVAVLFYRPAFQARTVVRMIGAVVLGIGLAVFLLPYGDTDFWLFIPSDLKSDANGLASGRLTLWTASWQAFQGVALFGAGPGASAWILPQGIEKHIQPHNLVIQFLLNWGVVAASAAFFLLARAIFAVHRRACRAEIAVPFVLAADCLLAIGFLDGTFHFAQHLMLWAAMMGCALGVPETQPETADGEPRYS